MVATTDEVKELNEVSASEVQVAPANEPVITEEEFEKAQKTFQLGKKNLFLNKYDESVNNIGEACKTYSTKYGEFDPQCAEVYFFYGRALLELARVENTVLGNALTGVPEDSGPINDSRYGNPEDLPAEEKKEISDKVIDALCEPDEPAATTSEEVPKEEVVAEKKEEVAETKADEVKEATEEEKKEDGEGEEEEEEEDEEDEEEAEGAEEDLTKNDEQAKDEAEAEEISNLQRSWEMFELAKLVYSKHFDSDMAFKNKRIAECLLKLGEISIEQESYDQAIVDITESIKIQEEDKEQPRDERMLAESFYQLGLAQQFNNMFNEANESYQKSINIMQLRVEKLKAKVAEAPASGEDAELERTTWKDEISELEALLPEMLGKLEEVQQGQQSLTLIKEAKECFINTVTSGEASAAVAGGDVKDITSLVKSKRKVTESPSAENGGTKKTKIENGEKEEDIEVDSQAVENKENETTSKPEEMTKPTEETNAKIAEQITEAAAEITA